MTEQPITLTVAQWLGEENDLTPEQRERFTELVTAYRDEIERERDDYGTWEYETTWAEENTAAWTAALEIVTGEFNLARRGRAMSEARDAAYQGAVMATLAGTTEVQAAADARIGRPTLRRALGK